MLINIMLAAFMCGLLYVGALQVKIYQYSRTKRIPVAIDYLIVLGARVKGTEPHRLCKGEFIQRHYFSSKTRLR